MHFASRMPASRPSSCRSAPEGSLPIRAGAAGILAANERDLSAARAGNLTPAQLDRLALERGARAVAAMPPRMVEGLTASQRRDLARWIGEGWLDELIARVAAGR